MWASITLNANVTGKSGRPHMHFTQFSLSAKKLCFFIMNTSIIQTTNVVTRNVVIPFLSQNKLYSTLYVEIVRKNQFQANALSCACCSNGIVNVLFKQNSFRNIALILRTVMNIQVLHTIISNWCAKFALLFHNIAVELIPMLNFDSDEWHTNETIVKIRGMKYCLWLVVHPLSLVFIFSNTGNSPQALSLLNSVKRLGNPRTVVAHRYIL